MSNVPRIYSQAIRRRWSDLLGKARNVQEVLAVGVLCVVLEPSREPFVRTVCIVVLLIILVVVFKMPAELPHLPWLP